MSGSPEARVARWHRKLPGSVSRVVPWSFAPEVEAHGLVLSTVSSALQSGCSHVRGGDASGSLRRDVR
eukprot:520845-Prymnesium_polylepis.1